MVWEHDLIRLWHERGASLIHMPASEIMNVDVISCGLTARVDDVLRSMTNQQIRHLPVSPSRRVAPPCPARRLVRDRVGPVALP
jgi:predicted transcriptional regulator